MLKILIDKLKISDLEKNNKLYNVLRGLNLKGAMRDELVNAIGSFRAFKDFKDKKESWQHHVIFIAKSPNNQILGWSLYFPCDWRKSQMISYFYVRKSSRRKGIGTLLYNKVDELAQVQKKRFECYPWDQISRQFFKSVNYRY